MTLYPLDYLPTKNGAQMEVIEFFVKGLERLLGVKRKHIELKKMWAECPPEGVTERDVSVYLGTVRVSKTE